MVMLFSVKTTSLTTTFLKYFFLVGGKKMPYPNVNDYDRWFKYVLFSVVTGIGIIIVVITVVS